MRAEIVIPIGGRLWSLYDKVAKKDLLLNNQQFLPGNLALRNAWVASGVEFNIGQFGHDAQTSSQRFAATFTDDVLKCPVLRIYEFNRDRMTPFQLDFFLPDNSKFLFIRPRIHNQTGDVQPMYWWSNAAVPEEKDARLIVPAKETYAAAYLGHLEEAEAILMKDGGLEIWDVREGEFSTSQIYIYIQQEKAKKQGIDLAEEDVDVPIALDLRMNRPARKNKNG